MNGKPRDKRRWSRREFVATTALVGGALLIGVGPVDLRGGRRGMQRQLQPNAFLRLDSNDRVTVIISKSEMGQGVTTVLALIVADELGARWDQVEVERAPLDQKSYGAQATGGSSTVRLMWEPLRRAGAVGRALLESAAAVYWNLDPSESDAPRRIDVHFMASERPPSGLGEPPVPPAAAALANALHRATGHRFRRQPFDKDFAESTTGAKG